MKYFFNILIFFLVGSVVLNAQGDMDSYNLNPDYRLRWKVEGDKLKFRICPIDGVSWERGVKFGYTVNQYLVNGSGKSLLKSIPVKVTSRDEWYNTNSYSELYQGVADLIYFEPQKYIGDDLFDPNEYSEEERAEGRYFWVILSANEDFEMAKMAGLGFEEQIIISNQYSYELVVNDPSYSKTFSIDVDPSSYSEKVPLPPKAQGKDGVIEVSWEQPEEKPYFSAYQLEYSGNNRDFYALNELPLTEFPDYIDSEISNKFLEADTVANSIRRYYRLKGFDYFGDLGPASPVVSAQGSEPIRIAPSFTDAIQTDSNHVVLRWEVEDEYMDMIDYFIIAHSDSIDNSFVTIGRHEGNIREAIYPMEFESNHYILMTHPKNGLPIQSYPIFCMSYDNIPPHMPTGLEASIDTSGIVRLNWNPNTDDDLFAYEVFRTNFESTEFFQISKRPVEDTLFVDTLSLDISIEYIYYKIRALDKRHIGSDFTEKVKLKRPDKNPPIEADIYFFESARDSIIIKWNGSASEDVVSHDLYRKILQEEDKWTLVKNFAEKDSLASEYVDFEIALNKMYAYSLVANDDDGLSSPPCEPVIVTPKDNGLRAEIKNFRGEYNKNSNSIQLNWEYDESKVFGYWLYKSPTSKPISLFKKLDPVDFALEDTAINKNKTYQYYIKAVFEDGTVSPFSPKILIETKEESK